MSALVTQEAVEVVGAAIGGVRVTQEAVEVLGAPQGKARVTQEAVEVLGAPQGKARVTQLVLEVLFPWRYGMIVLANSGKTRLLDQKVLLLNNCTIRLFQNNHTPGAGDLATDYIEATFAGYGAGKLLDFAASSINAGGKAQANATAKTWTATGPSPSNVIYGYYVTDGTGALIYAEAAPGGGFTVNAAGMAYTVQPSFTDDTQP